MISFRTTKATPTRFLKFPKISLTWFLYDCKRKNEVKTGRQAKMKALAVALASYQFPGNCKRTYLRGHYGAFHFLLFWLHLDSKSFKFVRKFICPILLLSSCWWWCKQTLKLSVMLNLALFPYLLIIIADQNISFHGQVGRAIGQISNLAGSALCQSSGNSDNVCYVWGLPQIYEVTLFIFHRNRYTYLKVQSNYSHSQNIWD